MCTVREVQGILKVKTVDPYSNKHASKGYGIVDYFIAEDFHYVGLHKPGISLEPA
jgi:hypothetical protein